MIKAGGAEAVALTLGSDGALLVTREAVWRAQPIAIEAVSTVGAGDSFLGGIVAALAEGKPLNEAFRVAVAAGFAAVMRPGTELCHKEDVERLMPQIKINEVVAAG
jgi:6-phosphofructokinase 2